MATNIATAATSAALIPLRFSPPAEKNTPKTKCADWVAGHCQLGQQTERLGP
jgi:hypothetical protein